MAKFNFRKLRRTTGKLFWWAVGSSTFIVLTYIRIYPGHRNFPDWAGTWQPEMSAEISTAVSWLITIVVFVVQFTILYLVFRSEQNAKQLKEEAERLREEARQLQDTSNNQLQKRLDILQKQNAELENQNKTLTKLGVPPQPTFAATKTDEEYRILRIAQQDRDAIHLSVPLISCEIQVDLDGTPDRVYFQFGVFNGSAYPISINKVEGYIQYDEKQLKGEMGFGQSKIDKLESHFPGRIDIVQWINSEETEVLRKYSKMPPARSVLQSLYQHEPHFSFRHLRFVITDGENKDRILPSPLNFTHYFIGITLTGKIIKM